MSCNVVQLIDELVNAWNEHDLDRVAACYAQDYRGKDIGEAAPQDGKTGVRQSVARYLEAFPDIRFEHQEIVFQGDRVAVVWTAQGTHLGSLMNIPPTGRKVKVNGVSLFTVADCTIIDGLYLWDVAGMLRAINLLPEL